MAELSELSDADLNAEFDVASKAAEEARAYLETVSAEWHARLSTANARAYIIGLGEDAKRVLAQVLSEAGGIESEEKVNVNG